MCVAASLVEAFGGWAKNARHEIVVDSDQGIAKSIRTLVKKTCNAPPAQSTFTAADLFRAVGLPPVENPEAKFLEEIAARVLTRPVS
ncbi:MAG: hypothetical protein QM679_12540 [Patulibacter sp.]